MGQLHFELKIVPSATPNAYGRWITVGVCLADRLTLEADKGWKVAVDVLAKCTSRPVTN